MGISTYVSNGKCLQTSRYYVCMYITNVNNFDCLVAV